MACHGAVARAALTRLIIIVCCCHGALSFSAAVPRLRALRQVSSSPLVFSIDDFVDAATLEALQGSSEELVEAARLKFATLVAGELFEGQWAVNDGLRFNSASSSDTNNDAVFPDGLHVDTNNECLFRSVTAILYLNDIADDLGGATVFPLAHVETASPTLGAARRLLGDGVTHTRGAAGSNGVPAALQAEAALLQAASSRDSAAALCVQPVAGKLCIFFSRTADGEVDPRSWHGGERLLARRSDGDSDHAATTPTDKRILTLFKEVDYNGSPRPSAYEPTFGAPQISKQRRYLEELAQSHAPYFEAE